MQAVQADMMSRTFKPRELRGTQPIRYAEKPKEWRAIRLPYKGSAGLAAVAVLPDKAAKGDVFAAAAAFTPEQLFDRSGKLWASLFDVGSLEVSLPRFKVSVSQLSLTKVGPGCCGSAG
jgi:serine protease inhibitor